MLAGLGPCPGVVRVRERSGEFPKIVDPQAKGNEQTTPRSIDLVLVEEDDEGAPLRATIVEVQRSRDPHKPLRLFEYLLAVSQRFGCPVELVVVPVMASIQRWLEREIPPAHWPKFIGMREVPVITDREQACSNPELSVLSAAMHGRTPKIGLEVARVAHTAIQSFPEELKRNYTLLILASVSEADGDILREEFDEMDTQTGTHWSDEISEWERGGSTFRRGLREGRQEGREEGREEGRQAMVKALRAILELRGITLESETIDHLEAASLDELEGWIERAMTASSL